MPAASKKPVIPAPTVRQRLVALAAQDVLRHLNPSASPVSLEEGVAICQELMQFLAHRYRDEEGDSPEKALRRLEATRCVVWIQKLGGYDTNERRIPLTTGELRGNSLPNDRQYYAGHFARLAAWQIGGVRHFVHELTLQGPEDPLYPGGARSTPIHPSVLDVRVLEEWVGHETLNLVFHVEPDPVSEIPLPAEADAVTLAPKPKKQRVAPKRPKVEAPPRQKPRAKSPASPATRTPRRVTPPTPPRPEEPTIRDLINERLESLQRGVAEIISLLRQN